MSFSVYWSQFGTVQKTVILQYILVFLGKSEMGLRGFEPRHSRHHFLAATFLKEIAEEKSNSAVEVTALTAIPGSVQNPHGNPKTISFGRDDAASILKGSAELSRWYLENKDPPPSPRPICY